MKRRLATAELKREAGRPPSLPFFSSACLENGFSANSAIVLRLIKRKVPAEMSEPRFWTPPLFNAAAI